MKKIAIIGASYLQNPLIEKANERGIETHVFAWKCGDIGEKTADFFYPISIIEKEEILKKCQEIGIDGICSIASDLAMIAVNYVANEMGLIGNTMECLKVSTNKHEMRKCFEQNGDPSPKSMLVDEYKKEFDTMFHYPIIVKPTDRSGSRGITKLLDKNGLKEAIEYSCSQGFEKKALIEEFATGKEYSVEYISWKGKHKFLAITQKYTTGAPHFIETGHLEPAMLTGDMVKKVKNIVEHALTSLKITYGASHSEIKIDSKGDIKIIEIGARMGGDCIGSNLVKLSTGFDFVNAVIDIALGIEPVIEQKFKSNSAIRFVFGQEDIDILNEIKKNNPEIIIEEDVEAITNRNVVDSSTRFGYYILNSNNLNVLLKYLPKEK